jgi:uncharacterized protein (UPF0332 family)
VDPKHFLDLAEDLVKANPPQPSKLRSATSRAYYAAFHVCRDILDNMGFRIARSGGGHGDVVKYLASSQDDNLKQMSGHLGTLQSCRNNADYDLHVDRAERLPNVQLHVRQARLIIETVETCCKGSKRPQIIEAMKVFDDINKGRSRPGN